MDTLETTKSNIPEFSVGELAFSLKKTLEDTYGRVRVRGELSRVSIAASGHMYSSLKDDKAVIDAICWKGTMSKLSIQPEEGLEVICTGRITTYPARSNYQLVIETMELAGEGALLKMLEERKKKLAAEGLFDAERKKKLPFLPQTIGVITSPTGAVIRDILHRLQDRFPRHVLLWPTIVQGKTAADQVASAIHGFQTIEQHGLPRPDVLIVARGGGSLEDLMPFNEESVIRAVAESDIPVISAVGHETDTTLCDLAADLRAPTPTGAAEMAVPVRAELIVKAEESGARLLRGWTRLSAELKHKLEASANRLGDPAKSLESHIQKLDHINDKITNSYQQNLNTKHRRLLEAGSQIRHPREKLSDHANRLERWSEQLFNLGSRITQDKETKLSHSTKMLESLSFKNVLARGYAVIKDKEGYLISEANQAKTGQSIEILFQNDQSLDAIIGKSTGAPAKPKQKKNPVKNKTATDQQSLF